MGLKEILSPLLGWLARQGHTRTTDMTRASTLHLDYCPEICRDVGSNAQMGTITSANILISDVGRVRHSSLARLMDGFIVVEMNSSVALLYQPCQAAPFRPSAKVPPRKPLISSVSFSVSASASCYGNTGPTKPVEEQMKYGVSTARPGSSFFRDLHYLPHNCGVRLRSNQ